MLALLHDLGGRPLLRLAGTTTLGGLGTEEADELFLPVVAAAADGPAATSKSESFESSLSISSLSSDMN